MKEAVNSGSPGQHPIKRMDAPGAGGASHAYVILGLALVNTNPSYGTIPLQHQPQRRGVGILFQNGTPEGDEDDPQSNGIHSEDLLAILIDRHEGFQQGPFNCDENDDVVDHLKAALAALDERRARRKEDGVLGQQTPDPVDSGNERLPEGVSETPSGTTQTSSTTSSTTSSGGSETLSEDSASLSDSSPTEDPGSKSDTKGGW